MEKGCIDKVNFMEAVRSYMVGIRKLSEPCAYAKVVSSCKGRGDFEHAMCIVDNFSLHLDECAKELVGIYVQIFESATGLN
jgi:hypothetical protein